MCLIYVILKTSIPEIWFQVLPQLYKNMSVHYWKYTCLNTRKRFLKSHLFIGWMPFSNHLWLVWLICDYLYGIMNNSSVNRQFLKCYFYWSLKCAVNKQDRAGLYICKMKRLAFVFACFVKSARKSAMFRSQCILGWVSIYVRLFINETF